MKTPKGFRKMLKDRGCSARVIDELWEWFDYSEKNGVASF